MSKAWSTSFKKLSTEKRQPENRRVIRSVSSLPMVKTPLPQLHSRCQHEVRSQWLRERPGDEQTMVQCDRCLEKLHEVDWRLRLDRAFTSLQPEYNACKQHPGLFKDWMDDLTETMNQKLMEKIVD
ncbi:MAG: hypothetical protein ABEK50_18875 [bacterium]